MTRFLILLQVGLWVAILELLVEAALETQGRTALFMYGVLFSLVAFVGGPMVLRLCWYEWKTYLLDGR